MSTLALSQDIHTVEQIVTNLRSISDSCHSLTFMGWDYETPSVISDALFETIARHRNLRILTFIFIFISLEDMEKLTQAVCANRNLETFNLISKSAACGIRRPFRGFKLLIERLKKSSITSLSFGSCPLSITHVTLLSDLFRVNPEITHLGCQNSIGSQVELVRIISAIPTLESLDLSNNQFDSAMMDALCAGLVGNERLHTLSLKLISKKTDIMITLLSTLSKMKSLRVLSLDNNIIDAIMTTPYLIGLLRDTNLESLSLARCNICDETLLAMVDILKNNHALCSLNLYDNRISELGVRSLFSWLKTHMYPIAISIRRNQARSLSCYREIRNFMMTNETIVKLVLGNRRSTVDENNEIAAIDQLAERNKHNFDMKNSLLTFRLLDMIN